MTLRFVDGFDHYQDLLSKWDTMSQPNTGFPGNNNIFVKGSGGRNGGGYVFFQSSSNIGACYATKNLPSNYVTLYTGFAIFWNPASNLTTNIEIFSWWDGGTQQVSLIINSAGKFFFRRSGNIVGGTTNIGSTSSLGITNSSWHYLEALVTINASTGVASLRIDGVSALNQTGLNTNNSGTNQINKISAGMVGDANGYGNPHSYFFMDDLYILDTAGSVNNSYLGDVKVQGVMPSGNGSTLNWTQNEAAWAASTEMHLGQQVKDSNGNIQVVTAVTSDAKTGGSAPAWSVVGGGTTTDNHVTWTMLGASAQWRDVTQNPPEGSAAWQQSTTYALGTAVWDSNHNLQLCTTAGTSNASAPVWNASVGGTTSDNTVVWTNLGPGEDLYLSDATIGDISRFTFPAIVASNVYAVCTTMRARKDDSNTRSIRGDCKSSATVADSGTDLPMSTTYQFVQGFFETDPNTASLWTQAGVNAAEFGVKTTA